MKKEIILFKVDKHTNIKFYWDDYLYVIPSFTSKKEDAHIFPLLIDALEIKRKYKLKIEYI